MNPERFAHPLRLPTRRRHRTAILLLAALISVSATDDATAQDMAAGGVPSVASHIPPAAADPAGPVAVIDRTDIELSGMNNVWDLMRSRLGYNSFGLYRPFVLGRGRRVSVGGNTLLVPTRRLDENGNTVEVFVPDATGPAIARPLGDCMGRAYTGVLADPYNLPGTGCGFAYDEIAWSTERREQESLFLDLGHPLGEDVDLYAGVRFAQSDVVSPRYAPSVGELSFTPSRELRDELLEDSDIVGLPDKLTVVHRFVGHGNRGLSGMDLIGGVLNVGDRGPSTDPTFPGTSGADTTLDSIRGRTLFLTAKVSFDP